MTAPVIDDKKWAAIARELPASVHRALFRRDLELYAQGYLERADPMIYEEKREASRGRTEAVATAARTLLKDYTLAMAWSPDEDLLEAAKRHETLMEGFNTVIADAERCRTSLASSKWRRTRVRDAFLDAAMNLWQLHGGEITRTTDPDTGKPTGKLEYYLVAVGAAVGHELDPVAASSVVRRRQKRAPKATTTLKAKSPRSKP